MERNVVAVLAAISVIGIVGIPLGDPNFLSGAIALEASYITLTILSVRKIRFTLIPNMIIAGIVIAGNTLSPTHLGIILTLNPLQNAIILILGGYVLQALLIFTSILAYKRLRQQLLMR